MIAAASLFSPVVIELLIWVRLAAMLSLLHRTWNFFPRYLTSDSALFEMKSRNTRSNWLQAILRVDQRKQVEKLWSFASLWFSSFPDIPSESIWKPFPLILCLSFGLLGVNFCFCRKTRVNHYFRRVGFVFVFFFFLFFTHVSLMTALPMAPANEVESTEAFASNFCPWSWVVGIGTWFLMPTSSGRLLRMLLVALKKSDAKYTKSCFIRQSIRLTEFVKLPFWNLNWFRHLARGPLFSTVCKVCTLWVTYFHGSQTPEA